jgi:hypothetical protein
MPTKKSEHPASGPLAQTGHPCAGQPGGPTRCTLGSELPSPIYFAEAKFKSVKRTGDTTMFTKIKLVLAAVLVLGAGSLGQAANENDGGNETGGFVMPGSMDGVNPAYYPGWLPAYGHVMRSYDHANAGIYSIARSYGFVPPATHRKHHSPR